MDEERLRRLWVDEGDEDAGRELRRLRERAGIEATDSAQATVEHRALELSDDTLVLLKASAMRCALLTKYCEELEKACVRILRDALKSLARLRLRDARDHALLFKACFSQLVSAKQELMKGER